MSKIIQIVDGQYIYGLDDEGVLWILREGSGGISWVRKTGSPNNADAPEPTQIKEET